jgi:DNA-binding response OmpR family regulator
MSSQIVLIVEDDASSGKLIGNVLAAVGIESELATDGVEALERLRDSTPGCVILDLALPRIDGWEVLRTLYQAGREVPVIVVTAHGQGDGGQRARELGAKRFFEKPFVPAELTEAVAEVLAASNGHRHVRD